MRSIHSIFDLVRLWVYWGQRYGKNGKASKFDLKIKQTNLI